jgi:site-specific DNA-methyltransferase (adenine-specific)
MILGDCLKVMPTIPDESIDFILTDPPYSHKNNDGDLIHNREKALGDVAKWCNGKPVANQREHKARPIANDGAEANDLFKATLPQYARVLVPGGCVAVCCSGGGPDPHAARWTMHLCKTPGLEFVQMVIWDKGPIGMGWRYRRSYEVVLIAKKAGAPMAWYDESGKVENIIRPGAYGIRKIIPDDNQHPTAKPVELAYLMLRLHTKEGDTVLDPFMGGGFVVEACVKMRRNFIGVEIDPKFLAMSQTRVKGIRPGLLGAKVYEPARPALLLPKSSDNKGSNK